MSASHNVFVKQFWLYENTDNFYVGLFLNTFL